MLKGFRDFILRGNVIELATAVIIGAAFTNIVTSISEKVINPMIAAIGSAETPAVLIPLREGRPEAVIDLGAVLSATINFLIVAAIVYFVIIAPMNKINQMRKRGIEEEDPPPSSEDLLAEIRDLLQANAEATQANQALLAQLARAQAPQPAAVQHQVPQQQVPQQQMPPQAPPAGYGQPPVPPQPGSGEQPRH